MNCLLNKRKDQITIIGYLDDTCYVTTLSKEKFRSSHWDLYKLKRIINREKVQSLAKARVLLVENLGNEIYVNLEIVQRQNKHLPETEPEVNKLIFVKTLQPYLFSIQDHQLESEETEEGVSIPRKPEFIRNESGNESSASNSTSFLKKEAGPKTAAQPNGEVFLTKDDAVEMRRELRCGIEAAKHSFDRKLGEREVFEKKILAYVEDSRKYLDTKMEKMKEQLTERPQISFEKKDRDCLYSLYNETKQTITFRADIASRLDKLEKRLIEVEEENCHLKKKVRTIMTEMTPMVVKFHYNIFYVDRKYFDEVVINVFHRKDHEFYDFIQAHERFSRFKGMFSIDSSKKAVALLKNVPERFRFLFKPFEIYNQCKMIDIRDFIVPILRELNHQQRDEIIFLITLYELNLEFELRGKIILANQQVISNEFTYDVENKFDIVRNSRNFLTPSYLENRISTTEKQIWSSKLGYFYCHPDF